MAEIASLSFAMTGVDTAVSSDPRSLLLQKARLAYESREEDARAQRILHRIKQTPTNAVTTPASASSSSSSSSAASIPIILAPPPSHSPTNSLTFTLPLLAPSLHAKPAPLMPTASSASPPDFIIDHNLGLIHFRSGAYLLARIYFTRALESAQEMIAHAQQMSTNAMTAAPPSPAARRDGSSPLASSLATTSASSSAVSSSSSMRTSTRGSPTPMVSTVLPPAITISAPSATLLPPSPHSGGSGTKHGGLSHSSSHQALATVSAARTPTASSITSALSNHLAPPAATLNLLDFLIFKQYELFSHIGLLLLHSLPKNLSSSSMPDIKTHTTEGLKLSVRCFKHCVNLRMITTSSSSSSSTASTSSSSPRYLLHIRLAEALIALHHHLESENERTSNVHPLIRRQLTIDSLGFGDVKLSSSSVTSSPFNHPTPSAVDDYSLDHAVSHLRRALVLLQEELSSTHSLPMSNGSQQNGDAAISAANLARMRSLHQHVTVKLAYVLLQLARPYEVIETLATILPSFTSNSSAPAATSGSPLPPHLIFRCEIYATEAYLSVGRTDRALELLAASSSPNIRRLVASALPSAAVSAAAPSAVPSYEASLDDITHCISTLAFIALQQERYEEARCLIDAGLRQSPNRRDLLQLLLQLHSRTNVVDEAAWLLKQPRLPPTAEQTRTTNLVAV